MNQTMDCSEARLSLGVYVLGAIDPAERAQVDAHLAGCRDCRDELAGLAGLPALLSRVSPAEAIALAESDGPPAFEADVAAPTEEMLGAVIDLTAARRRRRRWREAVLGVAAAVVVAAGVFTGLHVTAPAAKTPVISSGYPDSGPNPGTPTGPWDMNSGASHGVTVTVQYRPMNWGTQLATQVKGVPMGTKCQMWVIGPGKSRVLAGSWVADQGEGSVWYPSSASISAAKVKAFVIDVGKTRSVTVDAT
jgi:hypothetical protein